MVSSEILAGLGLGMTEKLVRVGSDVTDPMVRGGLGFMHTLSVDRDQMVQIAGAI